MGHSVGDCSAWCKTCCKDGRSKVLIDEDTIPKLGVFATNQKLRYFKHNVKQHYEDSMMHQLKAKADADATRNANEQMQVSLRVATIALNTFLESNSYASFEREIALFHMTGTSVGTINHSREFLRSIKKSFYDETISRISNWLRSTDPATQHPRLFSAVSDKMTEQGRTGHLAGIIFMDDGELKASLIAHELCDDGTCAGLAENLKKCYAPLNLTVSEYSKQLTGGGWDGQYFSLGVPEAFFNLTTGLSNNWFLPVWDPAHKGELALGDVRAGADHTDINLNSTAWYAELPKLLAPIIKRFKLGKQHEELRTIAARLEKNLYKMQTFCDTRFAAAGHKVYLNFCRDLLMLITKMKEHEAATATRAGPSMAKDNVTNRDQLELVTGFIFIGRTFGVVDLLRIYKTWSERMQEVNSLPWEKVERSDALEQELVDIADELSEGKMCPDHFTFCATEGKTVFESGEIKGNEGVHKLWLPVESEGVLDDARRDVCDYLSDWCRALRAFFTLRMIDDISPVYRHMLVALDLRVLIKPSQTAAAVEKQLQSLKALYEWMVDYGKVDLPADFEVVKKQHVSVTAALSGAMAEEHSQFKSTWEGASGTAIMKALFTTPELYKGHEAWCFLFQHCVLKMPNESVVESMGKTVADHGDVKRGCEIENFAQEAIIHWNAPPLAKSKGYCTAVLQRHFEDNKRVSDWRTAFQHKGDRDMCGKKRQSLFVSDVIKGQLQKKAKFTFLGEYE
jgi:hypothetical protein